MPYVSLHGRAFGYDSETGAIIRHGFEGRLGSETVSLASTGSQISPRGVTTLAATGSSTYAMAAPLPGVRKTLFSTVAGVTMNVSCEASSATFHSTAGSTYKLAHFEANGQALMLVGLSTAVWAVVNNQGGTTLTTGA